MKTINTLTVVEIKIKTNLHIYLVAAMLVCAQALFGLTSLKALHYSGKTVITLFYEGKEMHRIEQGRHCSGRVE